MAQQPIAGAAALGARPSAPGKARHIVGIDLGTSHTVVAHALLDGSSTVALLDLLQCVGPAALAAHSLLPSVRYQAAASELAPNAWLTPWPPLGASAQEPAVLGRWAADLGAGVPGRMVSSAKSWLSHAGVDRSAPILPWGAPQEVHKISPLHASASYLAHVRAAWDARFPEDPLHSQQLVLTVPASFDEGARALTLQAAELAGLPHVHLLEEPLAAFHDWLDLQGGQLATALQGCRSVLVVDVGGGTTDLSLIEVEAGQGDAGLPQLNRAGVGEHLMLGGDNMDLALAHMLEPQFCASGERLSAPQFAQLVQRCRAAKEQLLAADAPQTLTISLLGAGAQLLAQSRSASLQRSQVQALVVDGFFPQHAMSEMPRKRQGALTALGLPYPADAAISRHLAQFLQRETGGQASKLPDAVLLNGGVFHAPALAERLTQLLGQWRGAAVRRLPNAHPDHAVARGAVAYGLARWQTVVPQGAKGHSRVQVGSAAPRSYLLVLPQAQGQAAQGLCLLPRGTPAGVSLVLDQHRFSLRLGQAVAFSLVATTRPQAYAPGQLVALDDEAFVALPELTAVLPRPEGSRQSQIQVCLHARMTEGGSLQVRCVAAEHPEQQWLLAFALRGVQSQAPGTPPVPADTSAWPRLIEAIAQIDRIFGPQTQAIEAREVRLLRTALERLLGPREDWDLPLLRALLDALLSRARRRRRSAEHERVWLNLAGWCLRPGVGEQLDAWRMEQVWSLYEQGVGHARESANWTEWWVFWRRVAAGLDEAQQMQLLEDVAAQLQQSVMRHPGKASARGSYDDMLRLFAATEAVPWAYRVEMGQWMLQRLRRPGESVQTWWAIGRLCARVSWAANAHQTVPPDAVTEFLQATLEQDWRHNDTAMFAAVQMARMTGDRARDLPLQQRQQVLDKLRQSRAPQRWITMVEQVQEMDSLDQKRSLGDSLPAGLRLL